MAKKDFSKQHSFFTDNTNLPQEQKLQAQEPKLTKDIPDGYKPAYVEVKSKRVQLVFQPSIYEKAKSKASKQGLSLNEYIHRLVYADTQE